MTDVRIASGAMSLSADVFLSYVRAGIHDPPGNTAVYYTMSLFFGTSSIRTIEWILGVSSARGTSLKQWDVGLLLSSSSVVSSLELNMVLYPAASRLGGPRRTYLNALVNSPPNLAVDLTPTIPAAPQG